MEPSFDFAGLVQNVVFDPSLGSIMTLFSSSFVNEIFAVLPYNVILSGPLFFIKDPTSLHTLGKLLIFVTIPVSIGSSLGSLVSYTLAYVGGKPAIDKFGKYLRFSWSGVERMEEKFKGNWYDEIFFLALRSIPFLPSLPINLGAGILRMRLVTFFTLTILGTILKIMVIFVVVGFGIESLAQ